MRSQRPRRNVSPSLLSHARTSTHDFEHGPYSWLVGGCQGRVGRATLSPRAPRRDHFPARGALRARRAPTPPRTSMSTSRATPSSTAPRTHVTATLADGATPLADQEVVLEGLRYPYEGSYRVIDRARRATPRASSPSSPSWTATTACASSRPRQTLELRRAERVHAAGLRAVLPRAAPGRRAALPALHRAQDGQADSPTLFYLGSRRAKRASMRKTGDLERTKAGRYSVAGHGHAARGLERRLPLRELLPAHAGHGDGRPERHVPEALAFEF